MERLTLTIPNGDIWLLDTVGTPCTLITEEDDNYKYFKRIAEYEDLEEQGKLVKLPCANWLDIIFGDKETFWGINTDYTEKPIRKITVDSSQRITWYDGWKSAILNGVDEETDLAWEFSPEEIGKTVFFTREEAEAALKKMEESV